MDVEQSAFGNALSMVEECCRFRAGDATGVVALGGQFPGLEMSGDDVVLPTREEHRRTGVALTARAATQLVVQSLGAVPAGADDMEAAELGHRLLLD